jgi:predicted dehydrogenase
MMAAHGTGRVSRRAFIGTAATAMAAVSYGRVSGANDRVNVGQIGFGLIGRIHARSFLGQPDVNMVTLAETYAPRLEAGAALIGGSVAKVSDFRKVLDDKNVDAVVVATPDHWHALMTMLACAAGKDVYVEKPLSLFVNEGLWMIDVANRYKRVVQVGVQNRSGPNFQRARRLIKDGKLGTIVATEDGFYRNLMPGFGNPSDGSPPPELDWDMWLGPSVYHPYNPNRGIYHFRWFWDTSGGQMTNLGQHSLDLIQWYMGVDAPKSVYSTGGRFFLKDNCETPDTQDVIIEYPGFTTSLQYREATAGRAAEGMGAVVFYGTKGCMPVNRKGYELIPDEKINPQNTVAKILGGSPVGGPQPVPEKTGQHRAEPEKDTTGDAVKDYSRHARNFLDCVKSRQRPIAPLTAGHQVATTCHLANISLRTGRKITWNAEAQKCINDPEANAMLTRPYRAPWDKELRALGVA